MVAASVSACAQPQAVDWQTWSKAAGKAHVLAGRALDARAGRFLASQWPAAMPDIAGHVARGGILLLGEVHDNPDHHLVRSWLIARAARASKVRPAAVFEHIRADQQSRLDEFTQFNATARRLATASDLFRFLDWDKSGWPSSRMYQPLFSRVIQARLPILPGDAPRDRVRAVARGNTGAIDATERDRLKLDDPMPRPLLDALAVELRDSHCGALPAQAFAPMSLAQRYRDAHLADAALAAADKHGSAIVLTGNGHVRTDRGVPWHVQLRAPARPVLAIMLLEVEATRRDPQVYVPRAPDGSAAVDVIIFTPRAERADPCAAMLKAVPPPKKDP